MMITTRPLQATATDARPWGTLLEAHRRLGPALAAIDDRPHGPMATTSYEPRGFGRVAAFFNALCQAMPHWGPDAPGAREKLSDAAIDALEPWGLRRWAGGWELDNLALDYRMRVDPEGLAAALTELRDAELGWLVAGLRRQLVADEA